MPNASPSPEAQGLARATADRVNRLGGEVLVADENGLFGRQPELREAILGDLREANRLAAAGDLAGADQVCDRALGAFNSAWNRAGWDWRWSNAYGLGHFVLAGLSIALVSYGLLTYGRHFPEIVPVDVCVFGLLGATLRSFFWLSHQCNRRLLRRVWLVRAALGPWIGVLLGLAVFWLLKGSLMVLSDQGTTASPNEYAIAVACLFAGFRWEWALEKLDDAFKGKNSK